MYSPLDTDDEYQLWLIRDVESSILSAQATKTDLFALSVAIFLGIGLGALENETALFLVGLHMSKHVRS